MNVESALHRGRPVILAALLLTRTCLAGGAEPAWFPHDSITPPAAAGTPPAMTVDLDESGLYESRFRVSLADGATVTYSVECMLDADEFGRSFAVVTLPGRRFPLLLAHCFSGAHAPTILIVDPSADREEPVYRRTGAYFAEARPDGAAIAIRYDRGCNTCEQGFETITERWKPGG